MQKILFFIFFTVLSTTAVQAQFSRYIIQFKDKGTNPFNIANPSQYLSARSIARRQRYNIPIDSTDLPITPRYIDSVRLSGAVTIINVSKWLNQVLIKTSDATALAKINTLPFVISTASIAPFTLSLSTPTNKFGTSGTTPLPYAPSQTDNLKDVFNYGKSNGQVKIHNGDFLHNHGFRGEGMQMAVLDAGFFNYLTLPTFDSIRQNNQILGTWDFVKNEVSVNEDNPHGMQCLSTIAANLPGLFVGSAPKTSFYLYRTEDVGSEYPIEEQNFAAGLERADSLGVDITSTSLGYYKFDNPVFDYTYANMDGNTTISARAADLGAKKGMMMVVANGNEGNNSWHYLITPADGDSVLAVGAVDTVGNVASFSSYGPSSDGQVKPNLASVGLAAIVANTSTGTPVYGNGTSFACPNLAGIVTCLWQAFPEVNNMGIIDALQKAGSRNANPNDRVGYGIPDAKKAFVFLLKKSYTQQASINNCTANIQLRVKADTSMSVTLQRKTANGNAYTNLQTKKGLGTFTQQDFTFTDILTAAQPGAVQYRLVMSISTDTTFFLDSTSVNQTSTCSTTNGAPVSLTPNPVISDLTVLINPGTPANYQVIVQNAAGQKVYQGNLQPITGQGILTVPMRRFSSGVYFVTVFADKNKVLVQEIFKR
ncbi:MAG: S8 family serine peptidase [Ferruginibacter sp.]